jgi:hypothetical protein
MYKDHAPTVRFPWPSYRPEEIAKRLATVIVSGNGNKLPERILIVPTVGSVPWDPYFDEKSKKHKKIPDYGRFIDFDILEVITRDTHLGYQSLIYSRHKHISRRPRFNIRKKIAEMSFSVDWTDHESMKRLMGSLCIALGRLSFEFKYFC